MKLTKRESEIIGQFLANLYNRNLIHDYDFYVKNIDDSDVSKMVEAELILMFKALKKEIYFEISDILLNHAMTDQSVIDNVIEDKVIIQ
mgnify:CR=1 FL=1